MKRPAVEKARARLSRASESLSLIEASDSYESFQSAWTDLLIHLNSVYSILEQGSRGNGKSEAWFGRKKNERRTDPLLQYVHQARNSDEHGIEPITKLEPGGIGIGVAGESVHIERMTFDGRGNMNAIINPIDGKYPTVRIRGPRATLIPVKNAQFGDTFHPPTEHLGEKLTDTSPTAVARLAYSHHAKVIEEAENLL